MGHRCRESHNYSALTRHLMLLGEHHSFLLLFGYEYHPNAISYASTLLVTSSRKTHQRRKFYISSAKGKEFNKI